MLHAFRPRPIPLACLLFAAVLTAHTARAQGQSRIEVHQYGYNSTVSSQSGGNSYTAPQPAYVPPATPAAPPIVAVPVSPNQGVIIATPQMGGGPSVHVVVPLAPGEATPAPGPAPAPITPPPLGEATPPSLPQSAASTSAAAVLPVAPEDVPSSSSPSKFWLAIAAAILVGIGFGWLVFRAKDPALASLGDYGDTTAPAPDPIRTTAASTAQEELASNKQLPALWQEALHAAGGHEATAKRLYLDRRVTQLLHAEKERRWKAAVADSNLPSA